MKYIYTLINPERTSETVIGAYDKDSKAEGVAKRKYPADWLSLCLIMKRRAVKPGEKVKPGTAWLEGEIEQQPAS